MQSIQAKKEGLLRVFGMVIILFGLLFSIILDIFIFDLTLYVYILLIFVPWFTYIIIIKLEIDFFVEKMMIFMIILTIYSVIILVIGIPLCANESISLIFITTAVSNILIILCWEFALSIYKKKKLIFLIGGFGYCLLTVIFRTLPLMEKLNEIINLEILALAISLVPLGLVFLGMCSIIFAELKMKKKGLLNWV